MSTKKRKRDMLGIVLRILILVAVALTVLLVVLRYDEIRSNGFAATFFGDVSSADTAQRAEVLEFSADAKNVFHTYKNGLVVLSPSGIDVLDDNGETTLSVAKNFARPAIASSDAYMIAYDAGGKNMLYLKNKGEAEEVRNDSPVIHAAVNAKGAYVLLTEESGAKTTATAYSNRHEEMLKWYSSERYITLCDIAPAGDRLAFAGVKQQNARIVSSVILFNTSGEEPIGTWEMLDDMVIALYFLDDNHILAVCENEAVILDGKTAAEIGSYSYGGYSLASCSVGSDFIALRLAGSGVGEVSHIETIDFSAEQIASLTVSGVVSMSASENYIGVLTSDTLLVYNMNLEREAEGTSVGGARSLILRPSKEALIFTSNSAIIYQY